MSLQSKSPVLYLPVEDRHREFDAKLLVAAAAAERGMVAVVGQQSLLTQLIGAWVPGVFVVKGLNRVQKRFLDIGRQFGHVMTVVDEEAMGVADPDYMAKDADPTLESDGLLVLAQGHVQAAMLRERRGFPAEAVEITGNPRLDLLRPPLLGPSGEEAARIRAHHGPFVLFNTNTCAVNSAWGDLTRYRELCEQIGWITPGDSEEEALWDRHIAHDKASEAEIRRAIDLLSARLSGHAIIIRPHPSERFETWEERYAGHRRIHVLREGSHIPWMQAADLTVHTSCTTGLEAELAGCAAISLVPDGAVAAGWYLSNVANLVVPTAARLAETASRLLLGGEDVFAPTRDARRVALSRHLSLPEEGFVFDTVAERLAQIMPDRGLLERRVRWPDLSVRRPNEPVAVAASKMTVPLDDARTRFADFSSVLDRFRDIELTPFAESTFCLAQRGRLSVPDGGFFQTYDS